MNWVSYFPSEIPKISLSVITFACYHSSTLIGRTDGRPLQRLTERSLKRLTAKYLMETNQRRTSAHLSHLCYTKVTQMVLVLSKAMQIEITDPVQCAQKLLRQTSSMP